MSTFPVEKIDFAAGNWTPIEASSGLEISYWSGELQSITSRGSCLGQEN